MFFIILVVTINNFINGGRLSILGLKDVKKPCMAQCLWFQLITSAVLLWVVLKRAAVPIGVVDIAWLPKSQLNAWYTHYYQVVLKRAAVPIGVVDIAWLPKSHPLLPGTCTCITSFVGSFQSVYSLRQMFTHKLLCSS